MGGHPCKQPQPGRRHAGICRLVESAARKPVFVGFLASYDFMFVYWYLIRFAGESPYSHSALDIKTLAKAAMGTGYRGSVKRNMPS